MKQTGQILIGLIVVLFWVLGFCGHPGTDPFTKENFYECIHPIHWYTVIGIIFFHVFAFFVSGAWKKLLGEFLLPVGSVWPLPTAWVVGFIGVVLMFA